MRLLCIVTFYVTVFFPWHIFKLSCNFFLIFWDCLFTIPPSPREVDISMYENSFVKHTDFVKAENSATYKSYPSSSLHHSTLSMIWKDFFFLQNYLTYKGLNASPLLYLPTWRTGWWHQGVWATSLVAHGTPVPRPRWSPAQSPTACLTVGSSAAACQSVWGAGPSAP